jgi:iduronate 2-sulfatase
MKPPTHSVRNSLATLLLVLATNVAMAEAMNVLFIAADDLRPELGCYGHSQVKSPNIDRLAAAGTLFERAYCQQAVCHPSRAALMTGMRPDTIQVYDLHTAFRLAKPDVVTLAQYFKQRGYHSQRFGKIFHMGHGVSDDAISWSEKTRGLSAPRYGPAGEQLLEELAKAAKANPPKNKETKSNGLPWEAPDVADAELTDGEFTVAAIARLREIKDRPFFLAVGFKNPHLPFVAPKKYWDLYDPDKIQLASNPEPPKDSPAFAHATWGELRHYHGMPQSGPLSEDQARQAIHGYWAATSYVDAQVGMLLDELDRLKLRENTVVVLWGDHGWQLGEHGFWCKHTNYEVAARVPLIISAPGQKQPGGRSSGLVELVDIYPTLTDLCGLPTPVGLEGISLAPLLNDPHLPWKTAAFHLYPKKAPGGGKAMGRAIRTDRYRLVEWKSRKFPEPIYELYDQRDDPDENVNLANLPAHRKTVVKLSNQLNAGWRDAVPLQK